MLRLLLATATAAPIDLLDAPGDGGAAPRFDLHAPVREDGPVARVVNGDVVQGDDWADTVGIAFGGFVGCTGTLIAPDVVLTAGHCTGGITHAVVGTNDVYRGGDWIRARRVVAYPRWQTTYDVALVLLERPAQGVEPRPIAVDCVLDSWLQDGAEVAVVGFGATDYAGNRGTNLKHEGYTYVQDADCSQNVIEGFYSGCNPGARPGGEIGAGGNDVDSCFGDSGGPLYLLTPQGDWLVGVTSRSYAGVPYSSPCRYGGIYTRPDAVLDWIEDEAGPVALPVCNHVPQVVEQTVTVQGRADLSLAFDDEDRTGTPRWTLVEAPSHGRAQLSADGELTYQPDEGYVGRDRVVVQVDDGGNPDWPRTGTPLTGEGTITFEVQAGKEGGGAPSDPDPGDVPSLGTDDGVASDYRPMGCDHAPRPAAGAALLVLLLARRRAVTRA